MADWTNLLAPGSRQGTGGQNDYIARMLMEQGMDQSPIQSPFQGLARLAQAYVGKQRMDAGAERGAQGNQALADILAPGTSATPAGPMQHAQLPEAGGTLDYQTPALPATADPKNAQIAALLNGGIGQEQFTKSAVDQLGFGKPEEGFTLSEGQQRFDAQGKPIASVGKPKEAPKSRTIQRGSSKVEQQFNVQTGQFEDIPGAIGPAWKPDAPGEEGGGLSDAAKVNAAVKYNLTGALPAFGMGKAARGDRLEVMNYAAELSKGVKPEQLVENIANYKANSASLTQQTKQFNSIEQNANTAKNSLNLAIASAKAGGAGPTDSPVFNRWVQAGRTAISGDPQVKALQNHLSAFAEDYAKVMTANTTAAGATDRAATEAHNRLSAANSVDSLEKISAEMLKEMGGRHYAARAQIGALQKQIGGGQYSEPQGVQTPSPSAPNAGGVAHVASDADYAKLPSGAVFVGPDGHQRKKP